ncbi:MAG: hypothetical protein ABI904_04000 [Chloroflexota bacterium]
MKLLRFFMPRIEYILFAAIFWGIAAMGPIMLNSDGDLPRHLLVGGLIRASRKVGLVDIFSFRTTGFDSIPHEWLSQVIFSISYDLLGLSGVVLLSALIVTLAWSLIFHDAFRRSGSLLISLILTGLGVSASLIHILPRPHLFSYLLIPIWIMILERLSDKPTAWRFLPLVMVLWVNMHGMFIFGIAIWGMYLVGDLLEIPIKDWSQNTKIRSMLAGGLFSLIATLLSPSGFKIWGAIASLGGNAYIKSHVVEYQSANFQFPETWPFIILLLLLLAGFARTQNKTPWKYVFLLTAFAGLAIYSSRMLPIFAILATPIAAKLLSTWLKEDLPNNPLQKLDERVTPLSQSSNGFIWLVAIFAIVTFLFQSGVPIDLKNKGNTFDTKFFPVNAVTWLESHPQSGHVFNEFDWGGYLLLKLWPQYQIFMDGHTHIYGEALTREYEQVITLQDNWQNTLNKYQVTWAIVRTNSRITQALEENNWQILYKDETAVILRHP